jgi:hypothetical protein
VSGVPAGELAIADNKGQRKKTSKRDDRFRVVMSLITAIIK